MIRVVIDTNNLPRNAASPSAAFKRVAKLAEEGVIQVWIPAVVAQEWRTQQLDHLRKELKKADEALRDIVVGGLLQEHGSLDSFRATSAAIETAMHDAESLSKQALDKLTDQLQATIVPIGDGHGASVIEAYFSGSPPFSGVKSRKDFPDAYIYAAVSDIAGTDPDHQVVVVTADKNLSKHLSTLPGTTCIESLEKLVESEQIRDLTAQIRLESQWRSSLIAVLDTISKFDPKGVVQHLGGSFVDELAYQTVNHPSIPSDNNEATISMVGDPENIEIHWDEASDYGPGVLRVPFNCTSYVLLDFYIYYADAYSQPDYISVEWADPDDTKYFEAQAEATAEVRGFLSVTLGHWPESVDPESLDVVIDEISEVDLQEDEVGNVLR